MKSLRLVFALLIAVVGFAVLAQDDMMTPSVTVSDQLSLDGTVTISEVVSDGPGFIVIHADADGIGGVIGFRAVNDGTSVNVSVPIDTSMATPTLYAMLHSDTGEVGTYEFGAVEGADGPVAVDGEVVTPAFNVELVRAYDQIADGSVMIANVVTQQDGFVVVHAEMDGTFGAVIGVAPVSCWRKCRHRSGY